MHDGDMNMNQFVEVAQPKVPVPIVVLMVPSVSTKGREKQASKVGVQGGSADSVVAEGDVTPEAIDPESDDDGRGRSRLPADVREQAERDGSAKKARTDEEADSSPRVKRNRGTSSHDPNLDEPIVGIEDYLKLHATASERYEAKREELRKLEDEFHAMQPVTRQSLLATDKVLGFTWAEHVGKIC